MSTNIEADKSEQIHIHCPHCDKKFFTAVTVVDLYYKCDKCHRRYLINIKGGSISVELINNSNEKNDD